MFTGIIQTTGILRSKVPQGTKILLTFEADPKYLKGVRKGESIAVEGVCLTVIAFTRSTFSMQAIPETLESTSLGALIPSKSIVNLEKALCMGDSLGGHMVSGHVDEVGRIVSVKNRGENYLLTIRPSKKFIKQLVPKGSVALDGISLTVQKIKEPNIEIGIIPHTWQVTSLRAKRAGDLVNLELDMFYKYVRQAVENIKKFVD